VSRQFTLGKNERLKSRKLIEQLFNQGKNFNMNPYRVYFIISALPEKESSLQFGVGAGTRNFKKAVDRNRIKRLTREAWRLQNIELKEKLGVTGKRLIVFFIYTAKELPEYSVVFEKIKTAIQKLIKTIE